MATSLEHYFEAEALLRRVDDMSPRVASVDGPVLLRMAQVHATLALTGVTALNDSECGKAAADHRAWAQVASVEAPIPAQTDDAEDGDLDA